MNPWANRFSCLILCLFVPLVVSAQVPILTNRYDNARTGANLSETRLNTSNVSVNNFGKLWSYSVDGSVFAQPLYVPGLSISGGIHNVLYIVTMNDKLYAFDADSNSLLWCESFTSDTSGGCNNPAGVTPGATPVPIADIVSKNFLNIVGNVGIESTPVIDLSSNTMYLLARTKEIGSTVCGLNLNGNMDYCQRLHAIDITTGAEKLGGPMIVGGSFSGVSFDPYLHQQRPGLALAGGQIFIAWSSHEDHCLFSSEMGCNGVAYHGWVMSYDATTDLHQTGIFCVTPPSSHPLGPINPNCMDDPKKECGAAGGIWQSGRGPAVDSSGNVYYMTGNGGFDGGFHVLGNNYGDSLLKFGPSAGTLVDYFTPSPWPSWNKGDTDFAAGGPTLIPGTNLIVGAGKSSTFYVLDTSSLAGVEISQDVQPPLAIGGGEVKGGTAYWNRSGGVVGPWMYVWAEGDFAKAYHFNGLTFDTSVVSQSTFATASGNVAGVITLSANGSLPGTGILWSSMATEDADHNVHPGILRALNADDLTQELWNSHQNQPRDDMGNWPKFSPPTVDNGKVYMATFPDSTAVSTANSVSVYGLFDFTISTTPPSDTVYPGANANYTINTASVYPSGFPSNVNYTVSGLPAGATSSFSANSQAVPGTSTLAVITASSTPPGTYILTITGTGGIQTHSTNVTLVVTYNICLEYDATKAKKSGSTYPIKIEICDASGNNLSSGAIVVQAQSVTMKTTNAPAPLDDSGNANPDFDFRFDSNGYIYNLSLKGIGTGTYNLNFTVSGDPVSHSVPFQVK